MIAECLIAVLFVLANAGFWFFAGTQYKADECFEDGYACGYYDAYMERENND